MSVTLLLCLLLATTSRASALTFQGRLVCEAGSPPEVHIWTNLHGVTKLFLGPKGEFVMLNLPENGSISLRVAHPYCEFPPLKVNTDPAQQKNLWIAIGKPLDRFYKRKQPGLDWVHCTVIFFLLNFFLILTLFVLYTHQRLSGMVRQKAKAKWVFDKENCNLVGSGV